MKVSHHIATRIEGTFSEVMDAEAPAVPTLAEVLDALNTLALIVALHPAFATNRTAMALTDTACDIVAALKPSNA